MLNGQHGGARGEWLGEQDFMRFSSRFFGTTPVGQWLLPRGGSVKSIQRGTITISAGNLTNTATINAVDLTNARLRYLGNSTTDNGAGGSGSGPVLGRVSLTNATTVTATRTATDNALTVSYEVIEYTAGLVKSVQRGTVSTGAGSATGTATITAVDTARATVDFLGWSGNVANSPENYFGRVSLTNGTTVTLDRSGTSLTLTAGYQVVEWL